jgi:broad specificity phosphatase PhoE
MVSTDPGVLRLLLIRHAETGQNRDGVGQGRADNPLSELGCKQAEALADALSNERLDAIYASPLQRAGQTAAAIAARHALSVIAEADLIEMDIGEMEGLTGPQLRERHPDFLRAWMSERVGSVKMPGGESLEQVQSRAGAAIDRIMAAAGTGTVAAVSHNFVVLSLLCRFLALPLKDFRRLRHSVAGLTIVEVVGSRHTVVRFNDVCHLQRAGLLGEDPWQRRR